jgi:hypothetical protein
MNMTDEQLITAFRSTILRIRTDTDWVQLTPTTARSGGAFGAPSGEPAAGTDGPVHVLSAWYPPVDVAVAPLFDVRRHLDLADDLRDRGVRFAPAVGVSPDLEYGEWSWAVWGLGRDEALALARAYLQRALFEVGEDELVLVGCDASIPTQSYPYRLDRFVTLPCAVHGLADAAGGDDGQRRPCEGAVGATAAAEAGAGHDPSGRHGASDADREAIALWQRRYGLLGCDVCRGRG